MFMSELFYFYQILTTFKKLTFMSEVGLCLSNIDNLQLVDVLAKAALIYWEYS
jgi:hypothetical protein